MRRALLTPHVVPPYNTNREAATQGGQTQSSWVERTVVAEARDLSDRTSERIPKYRASLVCAWGTWA